MKTIWGVHMGRQHGGRPIDDGYVSIGWAALGDLRKLPADREAFKRQIERHYPKTKPGAVPVQAGVLFRFAHEMKTGDLVVYPSKANRTVNIGELGKYDFYPNAADDEASHRRAVRWLAHKPRSDFPQSALNEIGSALTLFQVANNPEPFLAVIRGEEPEPVGSEEEESEAAIASQQVEERTEDFVIKRLKNALLPDRFEHFVAHLLQCMGYHARVTQRSGDGGIDVIAHRDELGFEPPVIKVQCKQTVDTIGRPAVQQLMGAVAQTEYGLFVTLGSFSRDALDTERQTPNLRLIDGQALTELVFEHYERFEPQWQSIVPLNVATFPDLIKRPNASPSVRICWYICWYLAKRRQSIGNKNNILALRCDAFPGTIPQN
ncbi:restriction endonuclease [Aurantimonas sp. C2-6-R+9]|uniref:restriction endonuclease n=1 Tax=unclassified Aurantimonas TaxID=2638230 RepID=UPI002E17DEAE|nr:MULTISPECIES: restriction endonuclease [unclassified Aurantimonas]MEC5293757.1 restriction endonuclease [Aurantimonas sp. C2-3-R2]MEC5383937.1 restriction endonuclease [Aurantimonas sp. C2-6-R+9]MEC5414824.1 restriction endonuclease [Aurantimonas sp. C2-4-R8]